jgi:selenocysteine lyase/cysteine desulfurase
MDNSRRALIKGLCALPGLSLPLEASSVFNAADARTAAPSLPDKASFAIEGVYLDAAYTHPLSSAARAAYNEFLEHRAGKGRRIGPENNPRNLAVSLFAKLINAEATDVAVVPSTMEGENLVGAALGLNRSTGVTTDALHYDASLVMYREMAKRGVPVTVVPATEGAALLRDMEAAITKKTRLVAVSLISNVSGFQHDLKALCAIAHARGALVYADIIQAAGAVPVDVKASGVDFCGCGTYKWLMGDFGTAFLYVRPDRLGELQRVEVGWRQIRQQDEDTFPYPAATDGAPAWKLGSDAAGIFEVSTPAWGALACVAESMGYVESIGVGAIANHRKPLIETLCRELPKHGFRLLTPAESAGPIVVFAYKGAAARFAKPLRDANIQISTYENRIRISPSVYNDMKDIEQLLQVLSARS